MRGDLDIMTTPRQLVVEALGMVEARKAWSNRILDSLLKQARFNEQDAAFASALYYGVLERCLTLDACIKKYSNTNIKRLHPVIRQILRVGVYQILYMDSVPDNAAVNESVKLSKAVLQNSFSKYVNAVLRAFLRGGAAAPVPEEPLDARLSVQYSCSRELVRLWLEAYGPRRTEAFLAATLGRPPLYLRVNTLRIAPDKLMGMLTDRGFTVTDEERLPCCLAVSGGGSPAALPEYAAGLFHVQDRSSQLCAAALDARPGQRVLDACAAPGGKAFTIAQMMEDKGELVACELYENRTGPMGERARELGIHIIRPLTLDTSLPHPELGTFHRVLCDVPCSGLGTIRRKPEIKYKKLEEFEEIPNIQYKILENAANYIQTGGRIIYSTCTLNPAENEDVVARFLDCHPRFSNVPLEGELSGNTLINADDGDGFFVCALQNNG